MKNTPKAPAKDKKPRVVLSPAERIAKAEADLAALREREGKKAAKVSDRLNEQRSKLVAQIKVRQEKVDAIDVELAALAPANSEG